MNKAERIERRAVRLFPYCQMLNKFCLFIAVRLSAFSFPVDQSFPSLFVFQYFIHRTSTFLFHSHIRMNSLNYSFSQRLLWRFHSQQIIFVVLFMFPSSSTFSSSSIRLGFIALNRHQFGHLEFNRSQMVIKSINFSTWERTKLQFTVILSSNVDIEKRKFNGVFSSSSSQFQQKSRSD